MKRFDLSGNAPRAVSLIGRARFFSFQTQKIFV
jgi:hypothetical protein